MPRATEETGQSVTREQIVQGLLRVGLEAGDHVLVHSSLASFGRVEGGPDAVIGALLEVVGTRGTVVVPTFGSTDAVFDPLTSETTLGVVPATFWRRGDAVRSRHPLASVAAVGERAQWLVEGHERAETAHGEGTPYHKLAEIGGKVLLLGVDQDRSTFLHTAEEIARLPYLKPARGTYRDRHGNEVTGSWSFFPGPHRDFIGIQAWLEERGLVSKTRIGPCVVQLMRCRELLDALLGRLRQEPGLFISRNPRLPDGIWQRAELARARLGREAFLTAADSASAGHYVDEIIQNLRRTGVDRLLLSTVGGTPWHLLDAPRRAWCLQGLRDAGIAVAALRLPHVGEAPSDGERARDLMREAGTDAIVLPCTVAPDVIGSLSTAGASVLVENAGISGSEFVALAGSFREKGWEVRLAYDPVASVSIGENPFLRVFTRTRLRRHLGLLYVTDGLATGELTALGQGLAEIRELVSMLRSASFPGLLVLRAPGPAEFADAVRRFLCMLGELGS